MPGSSLLPLGWGARKGGAMGVFPGGQVAKGWPWSRGRTGPQGEGAGSSPCSPDGSQALMHQDLQGKGDQGKVGSKPCAQSRQACGSSGWKKGPAESTQEPGGGSEKSGYYL